MPGYEGGWGARAEEWFTWEITENDQQTRKIRKLRTKRTERAHRILSHVDNRPSKEPFCSKTTPARTSSKTRFHDRMSLFLVSLFVPL